MSTDKPPGPDFEDALWRLEQVVDDLERGDAGLSQALASYEEAVRLLAHCQGVLDRAERSVALLTGVDAAGHPLVAPFDAAATAGDTPAARHRPPAPPDDGDDGAAPF
jgi:exodeoxyribonuclease VII small subunit